MVRVLFSLGLLYLLATPVSSAPVFYKISYRVKKGDTFASILRKFVKKNSIINAKTPMIHKTRAKNPHIKEWSKLRPGQTIKLYISKKFLSISKVKSLKKKEKLLKSRPTGFHSSIFYMASAGSFNQKDNSAEIAINFTQNSLLSLGYSALYYPKSSPYTYSSSVYISTLNASESNLNQKISIPPEIGINGYLDYSFPKFSLFGGIDFENFSTFNTESLINDGALALVQSQVLYLTIGLNKLIQIGKIKIFSKYSFSKSLFTSTDFSSYTTIPEQTYSGFKAIAYFNYKFKKKWFTHAVFKYHSMNGPDKLTVFRLGLGIGYIIN